jgi:hypothetical protein
MTETLEIVSRLCTASRKHYDNPYEAIEWPESLDGRDWFFSPELISLYGTEYYEGLTETQRRRLSFWETINFFSLNIHGEKPLVEGLARRLYRNSPAEVDSYLHHFLDEENKHMVYFGGFCRRYAGKVYPDKKVAFARTYAPGEEDFLFFAKVLVFEEIVDAYNLKMAEDARLPAIVRTINRLHHEDETRHLGFGRRYTRELFDRHAPGWDEATLRGIREYLRDYLVATWREYYNPRAYRDADLPGDAFEIMQTALRHPATRARERRIADRCVSYLTRNGMIAEEQTA